jgi:ribosomal protein S12 methylthiotransferase
VEEFAALADELMSQRADSRLGENIDVLIEEETDDGQYEGRAAHQAPEVDGVTTINSTGTPAGSTTGRLAAGDMVRAVVTGSDGVDLIASAIMGGVNLR